MIKVKNGKIPGFLRILTRLLKHMRPKKIFECKTKHNINKNSISHKRRHIQGNYTGLCSNEVI